MNHTCGFRRRSPAAYRPRSADFPRKLATTCDIVEPLGNEYHVVLRTAKNEFTARFDPKELPVPGAPLEVSLNLAKAHYFDPETELSLV